MNEWVHVGDMVWHLDVDQDVVHGYEQLDQVVVWCDHDLVYDNVVGYYLIIKQLDFAHFVHNNHKSVVVLLDLQQNHSLMNQRQFVYV